MEVKVNFESELKHHFEFEFKHQVSDFSKLNQNSTSVRKKLQKDTNGNTTLDKESIIELIKAAFMEEFEKQQQEISKIIRNIVIITKQETGKLRDEINEVKKSITKIFVRSKCQKLNRTFESFDRMLKM